MSTSTPLARSFLERVGDTGKFKKLRDESWGAAINDEGHDLSGLIIGIPQRGSGAIRQTLLLERVAEFRSDRYPALYRKRDATSAEVRQFAERLDAPPIAGAQEPPPARGVRGGMVPGDYSHAPQDSDVLFSGSLTDLAASLSGPSPAPARSPVPSPARVAEEPLRAATGASDTSSRSASGEPSGDLQPLVNRQRERSFQPDFRARVTDAKALGILAAHYLDWDGAKIAEMSSAAFEDANWSAAALAVEGLLDNLPVFDPPAIPSAQKTTILKALAFCLAKDETADFEAITDAMRWLETGEAR